MCVSVCVLWGGVGLKEKEESLNIFQISKEFKTASKMNQQVKKHAVKLTS